MFYESSQDFQQKIYVKGIFICSDVAINQMYKFSVDFDKLELNRDRCGVKDHNTKASLITKMLEEIMNDWND
jgi:hypothetical protein